MASKELPIILKETTKTISQSPGWIPLSILCYLLIRPETLAEYLSKWFSDNYELSIGIIVFIFYLAGDILDKYIFPRIKEEKETGWNWITDKKKIDFR